MNEFTKQMFRLGIIWSVGVTLVLLLAISGVSYGQLSLAQKAALGAGLVIMVAAVIVEAVHQARSRGLIAGGEHE